MKGSAAESRRQVSEKQGKRITRSEGQQLAVLAFAVLLIPAASTGALNFAWSATECPAGQRLHEQHCITDPVPIIKFPPKYPIIQRRREERRLARELF